MNKQELIEKYEYMSHACFRRVDTLEVLKDLRQLDEPQPVEVPKFVADWIETAKNIYSFSGGMIHGGPVVNKWLDDEDNQRTFALAWFDGYTVEKEKRYEVVLHNGQSLKTVYRQGDDHLDFEMVYGDLESFTRKRLEDAGFGWVFNCEGIEIEEIIE